MSGAPYFEELRIGQLERAAPAVTLTDGMAAIHRAIVGDRLSLALDATLAARVLGAPAPIAHPALVWDIAIGQSTVLTGRVIANLFYRGLALKRFPLIGDTLTTTTEVVALRRTKPRPQRRPSGLATLRVRSSDQEGRAVLDFWRCAMLPLRQDVGREVASGGGSAGGDFTTDAAEMPQDLDPQALRAAVSGWRLEELTAALDRGTDDGKRELAALREGERLCAEAGDVVSAAPELARLTLNVAAVHHDRHAHPSRERLVYGGHTIGLAAAQATRVLPEIATFLGWHSCDHLAPVREGDTLYSELELERLERIGTRGGLAHLRARVGARRAPADELVPVLDWRFVALLA